MHTNDHFLLPRCTGMNCGATDTNHSPECRAEHAAAVAGGRFVKDAAPIAPRAADYEALEREHMGDPAKKTGIFAPRADADTAGAKPVAWVRYRSDGGFEGPIMDSDSRMCDTRRSFWTPLYAATPALSGDTAGTNWKLVPVEPTLEMQYAAIDTGCCTRPTDTYAAMIEAAPAAGASERADVLKCDGKLLCRHCLAPVVLMGDGYEHRPERADAEKDAALTDAEIEGIAGDYDTGTSDMFWEFTRSGMLRFARAILAANKEKP